MYSPVKKKLLANKPTELKMQLPNTITFKKNTNGTIIDNNTFGDFMLNRFTAIL
jgi:hypothetical protein